MWAVQFEVGGKATTRVFDDREEAESLRAFLCSRKAFHLVWQL